MKIVNNIFFPICLFCAFVSCQVKDVAESQESLLTFYASGEIETRTQLGQGNGVNTSILWSPSDEINIYCKSGGGKFVSSNIEPTNETVIFLGSLSNVTNRDKDPYWAVYPYSGSNIFDGNAIEVSLPSEQVAIAKDITKGLLISMARSNDNHLYFYNLCSCIGIGVFEEGVTKIIFKGNDNESLAGRVRASFDESGIPYVTEFKDAAHQITLLAPEGGVFATEEEYYVVCFPGSFPQGYTIELYRGEDLISMKRIETPVNLPRARKVPLYSLYSGGTIYSAERNGKNYSIKYSIYIGWPNKAHYWVTIDGRDIEIPEEFESHLSVLSQQSPTKMGPAVAIDTDRDIIYFARLKETSYGDLDDGVMYIITSSGIEKEIIPVGYYPYFHWDERQDRLELHSFSSLSDDRTCNPFISYLDFDGRWVPIYNDYSSCEYVSSGYNNKKLSDVITWFTRKDPSPPPMNAVDLGLSVKWGTCNLGAESPERFGFYYSWGELNPKHDYSLDTYRFYAGEGTYDWYGRYTPTLTKYYLEDQKYSLDGEDDVALTQLGDKWRLPTPDEWLELVDNCSWEWISQSGVLGYKVTGTNGNSIFLPAASHREGSLLAQRDSYYYGEEFTGDYLSSHTTHGWYDYPPTASGYYMGAWIFRFDEYGGEGFDYGTRWFGYSVRPVYDAYTHSGGNEGITPDDDINL